MMLARLGGADEVVVGNLELAPKPVSYTHLDVYKRQGLTGREAQVAGAQANHAIRKAQLLQQVLGLGGHALDLLVGCLLYTSRCV